MSQSSLVYLFFSLIKFIIAIAGTKVHKRRSKLLVNDEHFFDRTVVRDADDSGKNEKELRCPQCFLMTNSDEDVLKCGSYCSSLLVILLAGRDRLAYSASEHAVVFNHKVKSYQTRAGD